MKKIGLVLTAVVVAVLVPVTAKGQFTNIVAEVTNLTRVSTQIDEDAANPGVTNITFNFRAQSGGFNVTTTNWATPNVATWPHGVDRLYVVVNIANKRAVRDLERCQDLALIAMNRPDKYALSLNLGVNTGDTGQLFMDGPHFQTGYRVTFDSTVYLLCGLDTL
jgi:hypothetical protein